MTLHTKIMTMGPVDPRAAFDMARELIGATADHQWEEKPEPGLWPGRPCYQMRLNQGLPALMWVEHNHGERMTPTATYGGVTTDPSAARPPVEGPDGETLDEGVSFEPDGYVEVNFDTAYSYRADNGASCGDLHAWLVREIGEWLTKQGVGWWWYDESGAGWLRPNQVYGTLGDPDVGALGSTVARRGEDERRAFVNWAIPAAMLAAEREGQA